MGSDGVLVQNFTGRVVYANEPAARLLGCSTAISLLRVSAVDLVRDLQIRDDAGNDCSGELPGTAILRGAPARESTLQICRARSEPRWVTVRAVPMHDDRGAVAAAVTILRDVTEQRRISEFRENLLGIASHYLRSPLSAISMASEALARSHRGMHPDLAERLIRRIKSSSENALQLVYDLLDLTRGRLGSGIPINPTEVAIGPLVSAVIEEVGTTHPGRAIELVGSGGGMAHWDAARITQLLSNLLRNALTYGSAEKPVRVILDAGPEEVSVSVHNSGSYIDPQKCARIFEPFVRAGETNYSQRSIGLGLYIVREIASAHAGSVTVTSDRELGTTFTVRLRRASSAHTSDAAPAP